MSRIQQVTEKEKKRTTIYMSPDVLEFLKIRSAKGEGSVSQQLETLARGRMLNKKHTATLEAKEIAAYKRQPVQNGEVDIWQDEQVWD
jgi:hypothetical protein